MLLLLLLLLLLASSGFGYWGGYGPYGWSPAGIIFLILILVVIFGWH